jgi:hypothetical protein
MLIDLHAHEELFSSCGAMSLEEAVAAARAYGLHGICITNHGNMEIKNTAKRFLRDCNFPVFIGVEMSTKEGDMVAFGLNSLPARTPTAQEFVDFVNAQNGFCFAAHPYRHSSISRNLGDTIFTLRGLHGVEVANGANMKQDDDKALRACERLGLIPVGGSDAHFTEDVGRCATWFPKPVATIDELVEVLKSGQCRVMRRDANGRYSSHEGYFS